MYFKYFYRISADLSKPYVGLQTVEFVRIFKIEAFLEPKSA